MRKKHKDHDDKAEADPTKITADDNAIVITGEFAEELLEITRAKIGLSGVMESFIREHARALELMKMDESQWWEDLPTRIGVSTVKDRTAIVNRKARTVTIKNRF